MIATEETTRLRFSRRCSECEGTPPYGVSVVDWLKLYRYRMAAYEYYPPIHSLTSNGTEPLRYVGEATLVRQLCQRCKPNGVHSSTP